jgi:hypothetical protein
MIFSPPHACTAHNRQYDDGVRKLKEEEEEEEEEEITYS